MSQVEPLIERFSREPGGEWNGYSEVRGADGILLLQSLGLTIPLSEIYQGVHFDQA